MFIFSKFSSPFVVDTARKLASCLRVLGTFICIWKRKQPLVDRLKRSNIKHITRRLCRDMCEALWLGQVTFVDIGFHASLYDTILSSWALRGWLYCERGRPAGWAVWADLPLHFDAVAQWGHCGDTKWGPIHKRRQDRLELKNTGTSMSSHRWMGPDTILLVHWPQASQPVALCW